MKKLSSFGLHLSDTMTKKGFIPSPKVQEQLNQMAAAKQAQEQAQGQPADPSQAQGQPPAPGQPGEQAPPPVTPEDIMAGMEQLAQMIQQIPAMIAQTAGAGAAGVEQKKKTPAERMDAIEAQLAQLTGGAPPAGGPPAGAPPPPSQVPVA